MAVRIDPETGAILGGNLSFTDPGDDIPSGSVIKGGNFSQHTPDTPILVGKTLTIYGGNWFNVRQDPNWTIYGGNWTQKFLCANLHPEFVPKGLPAEVENCPHVVSVDTIEGENGETVTIYHYEDVPA